MDNRKTYEGWIRAGRYVRAGEKAAWYLVAPDDSASVALFDLDQTESSELGLHETWTKVVAAEDRPAKLATKPKVKVAYTTEGSIVTVWCGPHQKTIDLLRDPKNRFNYDPRSHRWYAKRDGIDVLCRVLAKRGMNVEATVDGEPYDWEAAVAV